MKDVTSNMTIAIIMDCLDCYEVEYSLTKTKGSHFSPGVDLTIPPKHPIAVGVGFLRHGGDEVNRCIFLGPFHSANICSTFLPAMNMKSIDFLDSVDDVILKTILSFFVAEEGVDEEVLRSVSSVCKRLNSLSKSGLLWQDIPLIRINGSFNLSVFDLMSTKAKGTEGTTYKTFCKPHQQVYAVRKNRSYASNNESVPYYMLRALAGLRRMNHPNITSLLCTSLYNEQLYTVQLYAEQTMEDVLQSSGSLSPAITLSWLKQLTEGLSCLHSLGLMHRNLKPKHILLFPRKNGPSSLEGCTLKIADFMAVRYLPTKQRDSCLTPGLVSLWYRYVINSSDSVLLTLVLMT